MRRPVLIVVLFVAAACGGEVVTDRIGVIEWEHPTHPIVVPHTERRDASTPIVISEVGPTEPEPVATVDAMVIDAAESDVDASAPEVDAGIDAEVDAEVDPQADAEAPDA